MTSQNIISSYCANLKWMSSVIAIPHTPQKPMPLHTSHIGSLQPTFTQVIRLILHLLHNSMACNSAFSVRNSVDRKCIWGGKWKRRILVRLFVFLFVITFELWRWHYNYSFMNQIKQPIKQDSPHLYQHKNINPARLAA